MALSKGLWTNLIFQCLDISDVLSFRTTSRSNLSTVNDSLSTLILLYTSRHDHLSAAPAFGIPQQAIIALCSELQPKISYALLDYYANYPMKPLPTLSNLRFMMMNLIQQTHNIKSLVNFWPALEAREFACLKSREVMDRVALRVSNFIRSESRTSFQANFPEGIPIYEFLVGFVEVMRNIEDGYFDTRAAMQRAERSAQVARKLKGREPPRT